MPDRNTFDTTLPDLGDPGVARKTLLIGFAFSLAPDGAPGAYNVDIAETMLQDFQRAPAGAGPFVGMQWEVYDALEERRPSSINLLNTIPRSRVTPPPNISDSDVPNGEAIVTFLTSAGTPDVQILLSKSPELEAARDEKDIVVTCMNQMLQDRHFYEAFVPLIDISDLSRSDKGAIGVEKRMLPHRQHYPNGLRRFQSHRVNRLILEAVLPEGLLHRGQYLNTRQVAAHVVKQVIAERREIEHIVIYAHPEHRWWCRKNVVEAVREFKKINTSDQPYFGDTALIWDANTAQVWCRSKENWELYKRT